MPCGNGYRASITRTVYSTALYIVQYIVMMVVVMMMMMMQQTNINCAASQRSNMDRCWFVSWLAGLLTGYRLFSLAAATGWDVYNS